MSSSSNEISKYRMIARLIFTFEILIQSSIKGKDITEMERIEEINNPSGLSHRFWQDRNGRIVLTGSFSTSICVICAIILPFGELVVLCFFA